MNSMSSLPSTTRSPSRTTGPLRRLGLGQGAAQLHEQPLLGHAQDVGGRLPARRFEVRATVRPRNCCTSKSWLTSALGGA